MKKFLLLILLLPWTLTAQDLPVSPSHITTGVYLGETPPLRDIPPLTAAELQALDEWNAEKMRNPKLRKRSYPYAETALPKGPDPVWQRFAPASFGTRELLQNFAGQPTSAFPPDANGTVGPNHYMQTINVVYAIYSKTGTLLAGPTALNTLFSGVPGATYNNGDPIILYDEQADRWLVTEFSIGGSNDYMLVAVSTTNDPTGTWHKYSFDVADMPDYPKFGIWRDGYYLATNTSPGTDIYVLERTQMLTGGTATMVGFDNPWRPTTIDGFMCVPPLDNDGAFAPEGEPGLFITINDDAIGGGSDQLWIYELDADWNTPANSTFSRVQQLSVPAFDSNFGSDWDNIAQPGTNRQLDAIPQVIMNPPQYRNWGTHETILCCHTVDVDNTDHAGIRWYELRRTGASWSIRQSGTYAPDAHSRWMGSIMLNGEGVIGMGYSVSSSSVYPGLRYCGQSAASYAAATGVLDLPEETIVNGSVSQTAANRWGDYAALQLDPADDATFWFTSQYGGSSTNRLTRIASFTFVDYAPGLWTGAVSSDWNTPGNWDGDFLPVASTMVTFPATAPHWPQYPGSFTLGAQCANISMSAGSVMTVDGDFTIAAGRTFSMSNGGTLVVSGNWLNNGQFIAGSGTVQFTGSSAATVSAAQPTGILAYAVSTFAKGMTALTGATSGPTGDDGNVNISIGFPFVYAGASYSSLKLSTNGWVSLNQTGSLGYLNNDLFTTTVPNATIAPWWDDLNDDATSAVYYKTEGTTPNRVFTAEWNRVLTYYTGADARISFQVKLYETTNVIEFHYGGLESGTHNSSESASIGVEDATGGSGHFLEATTGSNTFGVTSLISSGNWPAVNYRIMVTPVSQSFNNLLISNTGGNVHFDVNTTVNGDFTVSPGGSFTVASGKTMSVTNP